jgi:hypothetical protein
LDYVATTNGTDKSLCITNMGGDSLVLSELTLTVKKAGNNGEIILDQEQIKKFAANKDYLAPGMMMCGDIPNAQEGDILTYQVTDVPTRQLVSDTSSTVNLGAYSPPGVYGTGSSGGSSPTAIPTGTPLTFNITASAGTGGSISPSGIVTVNQGNSQTFTISNNPGFNITDVLVDSASQGTVGTYTFNNVQANHTISATFAASTIPGSVTLRPYGNTGTENLNSYGCGGSNWNCVDEESSDGNTTYIYRNSDGSAEDHYQLPNPPHTGTIDSVTIYINVAYSGTGSGNARTLIRTNGNEYTGSWNSLSSTYNQYSTSYPNNPSGGAWTWGQIDSLQAGVELRRNSGSGSARCTQVWVVVDYHTP